MQTAPTLREKIDSFNATLPPTDVAGPPHSFRYVERKNDRIVSNLAITPAEPNRIHIGAAGFFNFDMMAARKSSGAILCDINKDQKIFWESVQEHLKSCETREAFAEQFGQKLNEFGAPPSRFNGKPMVANLSEELTKELTRKGSWLATDESYAHIRKLSLEGRIAQTTIDFTDTESVAKLAGLLNENGLGVDTLYLSNIAYFLMQNGHDYYNRDVSALPALDKFTQSYQALTDPDTIVIEASVRKHPSTAKRNPYPPETEKTPVVFDIRMHPAGGKRLSRFTDLIKKHTNPPAAEPHL